jgi:PAS domain S-box-containing protein
MKTTKTLIKEIENLRRRVFELEESTAMLLESEERYRVIVENIAEIYFETDLDGTFTFVNAASQKMGGYSPIEMVGMNYRQYTVDEENAEIVFEACDRVLNTGKSQLVEVDVRRRDGSRRSLECSFSLISDAKGQPSGFRCIARDITARKQAEEKTRQSHRNLQYLTSQLVHSEERERKRLSMVLHDRIAQFLAAAKMKLSFFLQSPLSTGQVEAVEQIQEIISQSIKETRSIMAEIDPPVLSELGLDAALRWIVEESSSRYSIPIDIELDGNIQNIGHDLSVVIYQIVNEILTNIGKHSKARQAVVRCRESEQGVFLRVYDDGIGFDVERISLPSMDGGFGLYSIRERLDSLNGHISIQTKKNEGTEVLVEIPYLRERLSRSRKTVV